MLGKYRILRRLGEGGFAHVYEARDTVEDRDVALKVPFTHVVPLEELLREVRLQARLDHPKVLTLRNATLVGDQLLIAYPLGERSLRDRLRHRIASTTVLSIFEDILEATAYAHGQRIIHCDINPHNVILFADGTAKLSDFGLARVSAKTQVHDGSGSGTVGYMAPEQAMGQPSFRSDVFSLGILLYRMLSGSLPRWPYRWPFEGHARIRRKVRPELVTLIRRCMEVDERRRFQSAAHLLQQYGRIAEPLR